MNWSRTKSIFIICFLLLDVFLVFEMYMRQQDENIEALSDSSSAIHNYKRETAVPVLPQDVTFLSGTRMDFNKQKKVAEQLEKSKDSAKKQYVTLRENGRQLMSVYQNSKSITNVKKAAGQKALLATVYRGNEYKFWQYNADKRVFRFVQTYKGRPVYISTRNKIQMLDFTTTQTKVFGYQQSYFQLTSNNRNHVDLINAEQAMNNLADRTDLVGYSTLHITGIELCYLNTVGDESTEPLIFVPAWHIVVHTDGTKTADYFVNAVSGNVQSLN